jgi:hypothetical protein
MSNPDITGDYQATEAWPFKELTDDAMTRDIDSIVHVGDYMYRQGPCPINNGQGQNCSGMNAVRFEMEMNWPQDVTMNFVPGAFGDNWYGWWADFFWPAMKLLQKAPIIPTRGNHEVCDRGGHGYFFFLSPFMLCPNCEVALDTACHSNNPPYSVNFLHEQFLVMDSADVGDGGDAGADDPGGECPSIPLNGEFIVPEPETRSAEDDDKIGLQIPYFMNAMMVLEGMSSTKDTNFLVAHHPLLHVGCFNGAIMTMDWTMQNSLSPTTLDRVSAIFSGHMHWLQVLEFNDNALPPQLNISLSPIVRRKENVNYTGSVEKIWWPIF